MRGRTILLHSEQGLGDTLQFCRYAKLVSALGARVILEVPPSLKKLLGTLDGVAQLLAEGDVLPDFDLHCPLLSLPKACNTVMENIPASARYIGSDPAKVAQWRTRLGSQTMPRAGLVWSGSTIHQNDHNRSISLKEFVKSLPEGLQYLSLQKEVRKEDQQVLDSRPDIMSMGVQLQDYSDTAALVELMDIIVTVDTSMAHLAGAMGKPVSILLPYNPDWRWLLNRSDSPWYPSATLYRQEKPGDWDSVFEKLRLELSNAITRHRIVPSGANQDILAEGIFQQGLALHKQGRLAQAQIQYELTLKLKSNHFDALHMLGVIAAQSQHYQQAVEWLSQAIAINPHHAAAHCNLGVARNALKQSGAAIASYELAIAIKPDYAEAYFNRGIALQETGQLEAALKSYDQAIALRPDHAEAYGNRGVVLKTLKRIDAAIDNFDQALSLQPDYAVAYYNKGNALQELGRLSDAVAQYEQAVLLRPDYFEAYTNRANALRALNQLDAAALSYQQAIAINPGYAEAHFCLALCHLVSGNFTEGWQLYEWRWKQKKWENHQRSFSQPLWLGNASLSGKGILLYSEQGMGDTLQFCRYVKQVSALGARVILEVPAELKTLLENLEGVTELITTGNKATFFDYHCPLLSLPLAFKTELKNIPAPVRYLNSRADKVVEWRARLGEKSAPRIGLVWSGNAAHSNDHNRSIPLKDFIKLLPSGYQYVSLQQEMRKEDRQLLATRTDILHFGAELKDFSDSAALCELMDHIVSVDTSMAHLAGAMGKPVSILLPFSPDWRWMLNSSDSPWYPSATLYRQEKPGDWQSVFEKVRLALSAAMTQHRITASGVNQDMLAQGIFQQGLSLHKQAKLNEARLQYQLTLKLKPNHFDALHMLGVIAAQNQHYQQAVEWLSQAIAINPQHAVTHCNLGYARNALKQSDAAIASYELAIALKPAYADAHYNRGIVLQELKRLIEAVQSYDQAIAYQPDYAGAYYNRGIVLEELNRPAEAVQSYQQAILLKPDYPFLQGMLLSAKMYICDWLEVESQFSILAQKLDRGEKVLQPFQVLNVIDSPALQRKAAEIRIAMSPAAAEPMIENTRQGKIRIGYYSADFHNHATAHLMAQLFEEHDKDSFEWIAFSFGPDAKDPMRNRIAVAFDQFIDVRNQSDREVVELSRKLGIDIAVDLKGFTRDNRTGIFALRAAPLQVNYLGYPGTMGASYMDYLIADHTLIPEYNQSHYAEKIAYLPHSYQVNDARRVIAEKIFSRTELELPDNGFVFCCFNNSYKITPNIFSGWMRILKQVDGSVLWLFESNPAAATNLRKQAENRGVSGERLIFAKRMPQSEHLARHRAADLFLDTLPCNAHTTASDALWAGLPVLTCMGESFASRVAGSLLNAMNLPELITLTTAQFEALAITLATNPARLQHIRHKLQENRLTAPLFNTSLFARHIENAYTQMHLRYRAGLPPAHLQVMPLQSGIGGNFQPPY